MSPKCVTTAVLLVTMILVSPGGGFTCTTPPPPFDPDDPTPWVIKQTGDSSVVITIDGFTTIAESKGQTCGAAVGPWPSMTIESIEFVDAAGDPLRGFSFARSSATADSISCVTGPGAEGFAGDTQEPIEGGVAHSIVVKGRLLEGMVLRDLLADFERGFISVGSAHPDGWFDGHHLGVISSTLEGRDLVIIYAQVKRAG